MTTGAPAPERTAPARPVRELLGHRPYWVWTLIVQLVNGPALMAAIAFAGLTAVSTGSAKDGGVMVASLILADVVSSGLIGKVADRTSGRTVQVASASLAALGLASVGLAAGLGAPLAVLCLLCAVAGLGLGGLTGLTRTLLNSAVPERLVQRALAINATVMELLVVGAPLIAGAAIVLFGRLGGVAAMAGGCAVLALLLAFSRTAARPSPTDPPEDDDQGEQDRSEKQREPLWNLGFIAWVAVGVAFSHTLGAIETAALPLAQSLGSGTFGGGAIITVLAVSSALAGIGYTVLTDRLPGGPGTQAGALLAVVAVAAVGVGQARGWASLLAVVVVAGLCTAPLNAIRSYAVEKTIPEHRRSEGFGWLYTTGACGFAASGLGLTALPLHIALAAPAVSCLVAVALLTATAVRRRRAA
ncbi:MFS transporter [Streptomyces sp. NPDC090077]|uniref:MFS transporter n=1 Tax=Streptomyces sp. NPDC090077 TaxID=3365938 RepID=UPI0038202FEE